MTILQFHTLTFTPLTHKVLVSYPPPSPYPRYPIPPLHLVCVSLSPPPTLPLSLLLN
jgi:hypothetical protein